MPLGLCHVLLLDIRRLESTRPGALYEAFLEAFADYSVPIRLTLDEFQEVHRRRGVRYDLSVGAFDGDVLVGFTFSGMGAWVGSVVGYDSGHGAKPAPGMVTACAAAMELPVGEVAMVGDSLQDLAAARAAGAVAVLVGDRDDLVGHADIVIAALPDLLPHVDVAPPEAV